MTDPTTPELARAQVDRRQGPRRTGEAALHYAREGLLQAALQLDDLGSLAALTVLKEAAITYRDAERAATAVPRGTPTEEAPST